MTKKIKCPHWGCNGVGIPIDTEKKFSFTKGIVGGVVGSVLGGPAGEIIGVATGINGKNGKTKFVCSKCGKVWEEKV